MFKLVGSKGTNKTEKLLLQAAHVNGAIATDNTVKMIDRAHTLGVRVTILSYEELIERFAFLRTEEQPLFIDDVEKFLASAKVAGFTFSI